MVAYLNYYRISYPVEQVIQVLTPAVDSSCLTELRLEELSRRPALRGLVFMGLVFMGLV